MKRAFFEWGAIFALTLSLLCFAYWATSISSDGADFELSFGWRTVSISASDGAIVLCDHPGNMEMVELIEKAIPFDPPLNRSKSLEWDLPGLRLRCYTFADDSPIWSVNLSLLIPASLLMLVAFVFIRRNRKTRAVMVQSVPTLAEPVQHPLD